MATPRRPAGRSQTRRQSSSQSRGQAAVQEEVREAPTGTLFDLASDDDVIYIWRIHPVSKKLVFMFRLSQEEGTEEEIQRLAGGGKYMCREKGRNDAGLMVFGKSRTVEIGGAPREPAIPKATQAEIDGAPSAAAAPVVGTIGDGKKGTTLDDVLTAGVLRLLTTTAETSESQSKVYQAMLARPHSNIEWGPIITAVVPLLTAMIEKKDSGPNPMEMVTEIAKLVKQSTSSAGELKDTLAAMNEVLDIKDRTAPVPEDALTTMAGQLPKILEVISSEQKTRGRTPTIEEVQARLAAQPTQPAQTNAEQPRIPMYQAFLNRFAPMLKRWAMEGKDPELLGEFMVQSIPQQYHGAVREFLALENAEEIVYQTVPDLRNYPDFTNKCFGTIAEIFEPEEEVAQPTEPEGEVLYEVGSDGVGDLVEEETAEETTSEEVTE